MIAIEQGAVPEQGRKLVSGAIEDIGGEAVVSLPENKRVVHREKIAAANYEEAARWALNCLNANGRPGAPPIGQLDAVGHREGFDWCGLKLDPARNDRMIDREGRITADDSRLHAYIIPAEEGLMIAHHVVQCLGSKEDLR